MKLIIDSDNLFKLNLTPQGQLSFNMHNGTSIGGVLTEYEMEQIYYRIEQMSEGKVQFDPKPTNYIGLHFDDVKTLEQQSILLADLRKKLAESEEEVAAAHKERDEIKVSLDDANKELETVKPELRNASGIIEEQASQLAQLRAELAQSLEVIQMHEALKSAGPAEVIVPAGELPKEDSASNTETLKT